MTSNLQRPAATPPVFLCGRYQISLDRPRLMGIVNVTPDSFSDGGLYADSKSAIAHARKLVKEGADILDVGGESTRPGATPVGIQQEIDRVLPVLEGIADLGVPVSIDSRRPGVMREALGVGVDIINDVNGFRDADAFEIAAASNAGLCIMHMLGEPQTMQQNPVYQDVVGEIADFLIQKRDAFVAKGVDAARILIDPGFGFGKTLDHNLALMRAIGSFSRLQPVLVGVSRKRMIGDLTGQSVPGDRVAGSVAAALWAAAQGAQVLRVHDVRETVDVLKIWAALAANPSKIPA